MPLQLQLFSDTSRRHQVSGHLVKSNVDSTLAFLVGLSPSTPEKNIWLFSLLAVVPSGHDLLFFNVYIKSFHTVSYKLNDLRGR